MIILPYDYFWNIKQIVVNDEVSAREQVSVFSPKVHIGVNDEISIRENISKQIVEIKQVNVNDEIALRESIGRLTKDFVNVNDFIEIGDTVLFGDKTSYALDGTTDYLSVGSAANFKFLHGANDTSDFKWTISFFVKINSFATINTLFATVGDSGATSIGLLLEVLTDRTITIQIVRGVGGTVVIGEAFSSYPNDSDWHHLEFTYNQTPATGNAEFFLDGISTDTKDKGASAPSTGDADRPLQIGALGASGLRSLNGNIDEMVILDGVIAHTSNFTPPLGEVASTGNTALLIHCGEIIVSGTTGSGATFVESSSNGYTVTENGNAIRDTTNFKF